METRGGLLIQPRLAVRFEQPLSRGGFINPTTRTGGGLLIQPGGYMWDPYVLIRVPHASHMGPQSSHNELVPPLDRSTPLAVSALF